MKLKPFIFLALSLVALTVIDGYQDTRCDYGAHKSQQCATHCSTSCSSHIDVAKFVVGAVSTERQSYNLFNPVVSSLKITTLIFHPPKVLA